VNTQTQMHMPVAAMATARVFGCSNAFAPHAWSPKARTAYGIRRLGKSST
jgi:hypothetical protein